MTHDHQDDPDPAGDEGSDRPRSSARPRILIPITIVFAVRYVVRTGLLARLQEVCDPVLGLTWDDDELSAELAATGVEVVRIPDPRVEAPVPGLLDQQTVHFHRRLRSPSTKIDRARNRHTWPLARRMRRGLREVAGRARSLLPGDEARVDRTLDDALGSATNLAENATLLRELDIDAIVSITPFVAQERVLLWAGRSLGLPSLASILSFDNITTRPPLPITFDRYLVWNRHNRDEVLRSYRGVTPDRVEVVGAAQFDFYSQDRFVRDEADWRGSLGLPPDCPTVLYGAGAVHIAPHETQHVDQLVEAIRAGALPAELRVVLRRHPLDTSGRWNRFAEVDEVVLDDPGAVGDSTLRPGQANLEETQVIGLCSSLAHCDVHVSVSSTMTLDGAFFDRPQVGPAFDASPGRSFDRHARDLYRREHFVALCASGGLAVVHGPEELVATVRTYLEHPERDAEGRRRLLAEVATTTDGRSTERVADAIRRFLAEVVVT